MYMCGWCLVISAVLDENLDQFQKSWTYQDKGWICMWPVVLLGLVLLLIDTILGGFIGGCRNQMDGPLTLQQNFPIYTVPSSTTEFQTIDFTFDLLFFLLEFWFLCPQPNSTKQSLFCKHLHHLLLQVNKGNDFWKKYAWSEPKAVWSCSIVWQ